MKNLKSILVAVAIVAASFSSMAFTAPRKVVDLKKAMRVEMTHFMTDMDVEGEELAATVSFTVTKKNRINILDINCVDEETCQRIKRKLDGKKLGTKIARTDAVQEVTFIFKDK